ncbi:hypothetical protein JCM6882_000157 [Rhodosporidiobolus microsporus]
MSTLTPSAWFITGCSPGGFGHYLALELLANSIPVIVSARDPSKLSGLVEKGAKAVQFDVNDDEDILAQKAKEVDALVEGGVEVLVNNAGFGVWGSAEEQDFSTFRSIFETNVFGLVKTTRAFLPLLRTRRTGTIVNLSSIAGLEGGAGYSAYAAAKHAVEGFSDSLAKEVAHLGLRVQIVNPGYFRTNFLSPTSTTAIGPLADYLPVTQPLEAGLTAYANNQPGDPVLGARAMVDAVLGRGAAEGIEWIGGGEGAERLILGPDAVQVMEGKVKKAKGDLERWRGISEGTDLEEVKEEKRRAAK